MRGGHRRKATPPPVVEAVGLGHQLRLLDAEWGSALGSLAKEAGFSLPLPPTAGEALAPSVAKTARSAGTGHKNSKTEEGDKNVPK